MVVSISKKNQRLVNVAYKNLVAYHLQNDARDRAADDGDATAYKVADRKCETLWERYHEAISQLPKREVKAIEKFYYQL